MLAFLDAQQGALSTVEGHVNCQQNSGANTQAPSAKEALAAAHDRAGFAFIKEKKWWMHL